MCHSVFYVGNADIQYALSGFEIVLDGNQYIYKDIRLNTHLHSYTYIDKSSDIHTLYIQIIMKAYISNLVFLANSRRISYWKKRMFSYRLSQINLQKDYCRRVRKTTLHKGAKNVNHHNCVTKREKSTQQ